MRQMMRSPALKICAALLFVLMFVILVTSAYSCSKLILNGYYTLSESDMLTDRLREAAEDDCRRAAALYNDGGDPSLIGSDGNFALIMTDDSGAVLVSTLPDFDEDSDYDLMCTVRCEVSSDAAGDGDSANRTVSVAGYVRHVPTGKDRYAMLSRSTERIYRARYLIPVISILSLAASAALYIFLLASAGLRRGTNEIVQTPVGRLPLDIYTLLFLTLPVCELIVLSYLRPHESIVLAAICIDSLPFLLYSMGVAVRIKSGDAVSGMLVSRALRAVKLTVRHIPTVAKAAAAAACFFVAELVMIVITCADEYFFLFWLIRSVIVFVLLVRYSYNIASLRQSCEEISGGNLSFRVPTEELSGELKRFGEALNGIGGLVEQSVDDAKRSERFKAELITNVSHDIKTPLTSIINYTDLIRRELDSGGDMNRISDYSEVLSRQSAKLKRLLDDLIDVSKVLTGNLSVELAPCELGVLVTQFAGEYSDRFLECGLDLVCNTPERELTVMADGRYLWRVFDNLFSNVCKYALPGTRVYLALEESSLRAAVTLRNISKYPLVQDSDVYTERFSRGDASRNTEGSGLGLSVAKSLTELQGGTLTVTTDGDLFKVTLSFDIVQKS